MRLLGSTPNRTCSRADLALIDAYWRAANYLSVGQIYLLDNPLLREPLQAEHVKPRLLGHWGTTPGLNLLYAHMNRVIKQRDLNALYVTGPGHGGPGLVANAYLEGTLHRGLLLHRRRTRTGMRALFRQFSFPGGIPSHVAPETPGSIHEGGELGYALVHAYGAAFDNPDLIVLCVVGDGEAETGPLATSWHSNKFLNPVTDGAVLPILHLNGYKIANPTVLARIPDEELAELMRGYGYQPHFVVGDDPAEVHQQLAATLDEVIDEIAAIQHDARPQHAGTHGSSPPGVADDRAEHPEGLDRAEGGRRAPGRGHLPRPTRSRWPRPAPTPTTAQLLEEWLRSYRPEELFDNDGRLIPRASGPGTAGAPADERQPARQRRAAAARPGHAGLPRLRRAVDRPGGRVQRGDPGARRVPARHHRPQPGPFRHHRPGRDGVQPARRPSSSRPTGPGTRPRCPATTTSPRTGG